MSFEEDIEDKQNNNISGIEGKLSSTTGECLGHHEHYNFDILDETFSMNIDELFSHIFTDSPLFRIFIQQRQTYDVKLAPWPDSVDSNGQKIRTIFYTLSINYAIGPKSSPSTETQVMMAETKPGHIYVIDADCVNGGVPYGDNFYTRVRYCITALGPSSTRLYLTGKVMYKKKMWGLVKNFIEKTAHSGLRTSFEVIAELLRQEAAGKGPTSENYLPPPIKPPTPPSASPLPRRARSSRQRTATDGGVQPPLRSRKSHGVHGHDSSETASSPIPSTTSQSEDSKLTEVLAMFILLVLLVLIAFHIIFYIQLAKLESVIYKNLLRDNSFVSS